MSRLTAELIPAPAGYDATTDPSLLQDGVGQLVVNLIGDRLGSLRNQIQLQQMVSTPGAIQGVGFMYQEASYYYLFQGGVSTIEVPYGSFLAFVVNGIFYASYLVSPLGITGGALQYPPTWTSRFGGISPPYSAFTGLRGGINTTQKVRFLMSQRDLIAVQDGAYSTYAGYPAGVVPAGTVTNTRITNTDGAVQLGIPAPGVVGLMATGSGNVTGTVSYVATYTDHQGRESSPSVAVSVTPSGSQEVIVTLPAWTANTGLLYQTDIATIYRSLDGAPGVYYKLTTLPCSAGGGSLTYTDNIADNILSAVTVNAPLSGQNDPPQPATKLFLYQNRVWMDVDGFPGTLQFSNAGSNTQFATSAVTGVNYPSFGGTIQFSSDTADVVQAGVSYGTFALVFTKRRIWLLQGQDKSSFNMQSLHEYGCAAADSLTRCNDFIAFVADDGVYLIDGSLGVTKISKPLESTVVFPDNASPTLRATLEASNGSFVNNTYILHLGALKYGYNFDNQQWIQLSLGDQVYSSVTFETPGLPGISVEGRSDTNAISQLDFYSTGASNTIADRRRPLKDKSAQKRLKRTRWFGSGTISYGTITANCDVASYPVAWSTPPAREVALGVIAYQEWLPNVTGRLIDTELVVYGTNIQLGTKEEEYVVIG